MRRTAIAMGLVAMLAGCDGDSGRTTLMVGAAASLTDVLTAISHDYAAAHPDVVIEFRFGASSLVARQIIEGAPADLFFAADNRTMDTVAEVGLLKADTRREVLGNRLVIISPDDRAVAVNQPQDILQPAVRRIAVCDPAVPVGRYAKTWLDTIGLYAQAEPRFVLLPDVRAVLAAVDGGNAELGFVYQTDAAVAKAAKTVFTIPESEGPPIRYPLAVIESTAHPDATAAFRDYLLGPDAARRYREFAFEVLAPAAAAEAGARP